MGIVKETDPANTVEAELYINIMTQFSLTNTTTQNQLKSKGTIQNQEFLSAEELTKQTPKPNMNNEDAGC